MHQLTALPGKPDCSMAALQTDLTDPCHLSCAVLCGQVLARDGSECHPKSCTAPVIAGSASDFTMILGDFLAMAGPVKFFRSSHTVCCDFVFRGLHNPTPEYASRTANATKSSMPSTCDPRLGALSLDRCATIVSADSCWFMAVSAGRPSSFRSSYC